ncbi:site-2 protease family protein [bacterium]|nr:site-2 protease family protein [candidate division CSSED10-310 bacterium]
MNRAVEVVLAIIVVLISLTLHEAAHAMAAYFFGDPTARNRGRLSLNPLVHIDPLGTVLLPLLLAITGGVVFGWAKPVPINLNNLKNPKRDDGLIALAGPAANLVLAVAAAVLIRLILLTMSSLIPVHGLVFIIQFLNIAIQVNIFLMLFNILPIPPLDGFSIFQMFLPVHLSFKLMQIQKYGFIIILILVFTGILDLLYFRPVGGIFFSLIHLITGL